MERGTDGTEHGGDFSGDFAFTIDLTGERVAEFTADGTTMDDCDERARRIAGAFFGGDVRVERGASTPYLRRPTGDVVVWRTEYVARPA